MRRLLHIGFVYLAVVTSIICASSATHSRRPTKNREDQEPSGYDNSGQAIGYSGWGRYVVHVAIGTPPQKFSVAISTEHSFLWVPDSSCSCSFLCRNSAACILLESCMAQVECCTWNGGSRAEPPVVAPATSYMLRLISQAAQRNDGDTGCNENRAKYRSSSSTTYRRNGTKFNDDDDIYGAQGFIGIDDVQLGALDVFSATFGQAQTISLVAGNDDGIDGVFGLGAFDTNPPGAASAIQTAFQHNIIAQPIASIWMASDEDYCGASGQINYGQVHPKLCGSVDWHDALPSSQGWSLANPTFSVNGQGSVALPSAQIDFTASQMYLPYSSIQPLFIALGATVQQILNYPQQAVVLCNQTVPSLTITFDDIPYTIDSSVLVTENEYADQSNGYCSLAIIDSGDNGGVIIGDIFVCQYCQVLDLAKKRIGFAKNLKPQHTRID